MERLQTEPARVRRGTEREVIGPLTPILSDLCLSLELQLAVASYISIVSFLLFFPFSF